MLGDSVVASIAGPLHEAALVQGLELATAPVSGCGLLPGLTLDTTTQEPYEGSRPCADMVSLAIDEAFDTFDPTLVIWLSIWDAENRLIDDHSVVVESIDGQRELAGLVDSRVREMNARGVEVVLVTVPVVATADARPLPTSVKQRRISNYNEVLRNYAETHAETSLIDLAAYICPDGDPCDDMNENGMTFRPSDGIHFEGPATAGVANWLVDEMMLLDGVSGEG